MMWRWTELNPAFGGSLERRLYNCRIFTSSGAGTAPLQEAYGAGQRVGVRSAAIDTPLQGTAFSYRLV